jgi:WD40 repeat protein
MSGSNDETIRIWDAEIGQAIGAPLKGHDGYVMSVGFSPDGKHVVSGSYDTMIRIWDIETGQAIGAPFEGHNGCVRSVAFSPDGKCVVSGSDDKTIRIWESGTLRPARPLEPSKVTTTQLHPEAPLPLLASTSATTS